MRVGLFVLAWCLNLGAADTFAQTTSGQDSFTSQNSSTSGNSTTSTTTTDTSGNATPLTPDAMAAIQQQQQQLTQQFMQQLQATTPDDRVALIASLQLQMGNLNASLLPPALTPDQQAQVTGQQQAASQALIQSLPPEMQATATNMLQRQQLVQQMATATPEQNVALIAQVQQLVAQQEQAVAAQSASADNGTATDPATQAEQVAALPAEQQPMAQALIQRQQAIQAAMQLSPDDRVAALQAIQAQPLPTSASTDSSPTTSSPSSQP